MKTRRRFTREFKISVLSKWKREYRDNPETAFSGRGKICKSEAKIADRERLIGRLYAENAFLKKALSSLEARLAELRKQR